MAIRLHRHLLVHADFCHRDLYGGVMNTVTVHRNEVQEVIDREQQTEGES